MAIVTVATPMYGGVCSGAYTRSMMSLMELLKAKGHTPIYLDISNESLINRARNTLTEMFLRSRSDYLLFIDADQGFDANGILKMIEEDVDIIGAAVPMKAINWERVSAAAKAGKEDLEKYTALYNVNMSAEQKKVLAENPGSKVEVDYIGTGLLLIKRNVFETLKEYVGSYRSDQQNIGGISFGEAIYDFWKTMVDPKSERLLSEDYYFCKLWKDLGGKVFLAPYTKVVHVGTYWFR
jgi:hypothetical protein